MRVDDSPWHVQRIIKLRRWKMRWIIILAAAVNKSRDESQMHLVRLAAHMQTNADRSEHRESITGIYGNCWRPCAISSLINQHLSFSTVRLSRNLRRGKSQWESRRFDQFDGGSMLVRLHQHLPIRKAATSREIVFNQTGPKSIVLD